VDHDLTITICNHQPPVTHERVPSLADRTLRIEDGQLT